MVFSSAAKLLVSVTSVFGSEIETNVIGTCGKTSPSTVEDCQNVDFGTCGGACCKLDFMIPMPTTKAADVLNKSFSHGGADHMYTLQPLAEQTLGFAKVGAHGIDFIGQVVHQTAGGFNDTINFDIEPRGNSSMVRAFSISQIGGVAADNGQNYKNIMMAMKKAFGTELKFVSDGSCPAMEKNILEFAQNNQNLSFLVGALVAADLEDTMSSPGPFTLFAPTNDAFNALPDGILSDLMKPENKESLVNILKYHVLNGKMKVSEIGAYETVTTIQGQMLYVQKWGGVVHVGASLASKDLKMITSKDNAASNGVVHVIDGVLLPAKTVNV